MPNKIVEEMRPAIQSALQAALRRHKPHEVAQWFPCACVAALGAVCAPVVRPTMLKAFKAFSAVWADVGLQADSARAAGEKSTAPPHIPL